MSKIKTPSQIYIQVNDIHAYVYTQTTFSK